MKLTPDGRKIAEHFNADYDNTYAFFRRILKMTPAESKENAFLFLSNFSMDTVRKLGSVTARSLEHARMKSHPVERKKQEVQ